jgi:AcrR family transcriptional regulator
MTTADTSTPPGSREKLFAAAADEFAAHGFAGANVDRIARAARVNKAMIYYHFESKAKLYRLILCDMFHAVSERVRVVAGSDKPPEDKIRGFVEAIATEAEARPHFPPIWFREVAEGGRHIDDEVIRDLTGIVQMLAGIIQEGVGAGRFQPVNPMLLHGGIVAPVMMFFASKRLRERLDPSAVRVPHLDRQQVVEHIQSVTLGVLEGKLT